MQEVRSLKRTHRQTSLIDAKGLGKPWILQNNQEKYIAWSGKTENYIVGIFGEEFRAVLEWAVGCEAESRRNTGKLWGTKQTRLSESTT